MEELMGVFGDETLDDASKRLVVPRFEGRHGERFICKTPHYPDWLETQVDPALHQGN